MRFAEPFRPMLWRNSCAQHGLDPVQVPTGWSGVFGCDIIDMVTKLKVDYSTTIAMASPISVHFVKLHAQSDDGEVHTV